MGAVYEAVDQRLGITVALKETLSSETSARRQFAQEARLLAGLQHPALPRVSDHFTEGDRAFLVMQFISGVDLARIIVQQPGPFPRDQVVAWADQLLDALIYLHTQDRQVIHRDIKPHNLKVTANGQIALLDFGLAKAQALDSSNANSFSSFFGYTRQYAPLEQIQGLSTGPQSDIYALGATLYYLLTGNRPVDAVTREAALTKGHPDPLKRANEIHPQVGTELAAILHRAMAPNSEDRYSTAMEFREMLRQVGRARNSGSLEHAVATKVLQDSKNEITIYKNDFEVSSSVSGGLVAAVLLAVVAIGGMVHAFRPLPQSSDLGKQTSSPVQRAVQSSTNSERNKLSFK
jgi:eukaryotic-like serine/threonine-protein kinase